MAVPQMFSTTDYLRALVRMGLAVYTPRGFARWLVTPFPTFGGRRAAALLLRGQVQLVLGAMVSDYEGLGF